MSTVEQAIERLKKGQLIIVIDDADRENEGDLIGAAEFATQEMINFMATYGKGLICMPMSQKRAKQLELDPMVYNNTDNHQTAFTISIDHIDTTTGISTLERANTAVFASSSKAKPKDFRRPGHMFPLVAKDLGLFERRGHTEATVDLMKLADLSDCGLCVEMISENGETMKFKELTEFSKKFDLPMISVQQIVDYKKAHDNLIKLNNAVTLPTQFGIFKLYSFVTPFSDQPELALVKGNIKNKSHVLTRLHSECLTGDVFGSMKCDCGEQLATALTRIDASNCGVLLYLRQEGRGIGLVNKLKAYKLQEEGFDTMQANEMLGFKGDEREYFIASQILKYLKVESIDLLTNNTNKIEELEKYNIKVEQRVALEMPCNIYNEDYLKTKKKKFKHLLELKKEKK